MSRAARLAACTLLVLLPALSAQAQVPPTGVKDQLALLQSADPKLAANKRLVFDMVRSVLNAGHYEMAPQFIAEGYIQHNPNVATGRAAFMEFIRTSRPVKPIPDQVTFPLIALSAEDDRVLIATVAYKDDEEKPGTRYATTHFDLFRIANGKIVEHWDNIPKATTFTKRDPNLSSKP